MPYQASNGTLSNKPYSPSTGIPSDGRSYFYDSTNFLWRHYQSTAEVLSTLDTATKRKGNFPILVHVGGTLNSDGTYTGGTSSIYQFRDDITNSDLLQIVTHTPSEFTAAVSANSLVSAASTHAALTNNPHSVTAAQIGVASGATANISDATSAALMDTKDTVIIGQTYIHQTVATKAAAVTAATGTQWKIIKVTADESAEDVTTYYKYEGSAGTLVAEFEKLSSTFFERVSGETVIKDDSITEAKLDPAVVSQLGGTPETATTIGAIISGATAKTAPVDADKFGFWDSVGNVLKELTWANLKAVLKTYFDTLYTTSSAQATAIANAKVASMAVTGTTSKTLTLTFGDGSTVQVNFTDITAVLTGLSAPVMSTPTVVSDTALTPSWTNVSNETNYQLERSLDGSTGWTTINSPAANVTSFADTGLTASTAYYYRIKAIGDGTTYSDSAYSNTVNATTNAAAVTLSTPTLTAAVISATEIDLSWTNVSNESSFKLEWSPNGSTGWTQIGGSIAANTLTYNHTGLTASTHYYYRVSAIGDGTTYLTSGFGTDDDTTSAGSGGTELFTNNSILNNGIYWPYDNLTITEDATTDAGGGTTVELLSPSGNTDVHALKKEGFTVTASTNYELSGSGKPTALGGYNYLQVYVFDNGFTLIGYAIFNLSAGTFSNNTNGTATITSEADSFKRWKIAFSNPGGNTSIHIYMRILDPTGTPGTAFEETDATKGIFLTRLSLI